MRLTKFNPETGLYEYVEKAKTFAEYREQRKVVIQKLGEYEDKASEVAEEIFAEIDKLLAVDRNGEANLDIRALQSLKKKYTESEKDK